MALLLTHACAAFEVPLVWAALVDLAGMGVAMYSSTVSSSERPMVAGLSEATWRLEARPAAS